jgi:hypothetical protein
VTANPRRADRHRKPRNIAKLGTRQSPRSRHITATGRAQPDPIFDDLRALQSPEPDVRLFRGI